MLDFCDMLWYDTERYHKEEVGMTDVKELGAFVAKVRKEQGITQLQLSQAASVGRRFVVELERGKESIHVGKLFKVLDVLGIGFELIAPEGV